MGLYAKPLRSYKGVCGEAACSWRAACSAVRHARRYYARRPFYIASAYKGAEACDSLIPDLSARPGNQRVWSAFNAGLGKGFDARMTRSASGVVLTGWSRFGHTMPLCETFPAGVPSLLRSIALWKGEDDNAADKEVAAAERGSVGREAARFVCGAR